jgi:ADP-heptose:LPS heptosyltransferase
MTDSLATVLRATTDLTLPQEFLTAEFPRDPAIAARAIAWLASEGVPAGNFLLLNCSAGEPTRTLSELQARSIVRRAREELRMSIVLNAVGDERGWAENIVREHFNEPGARLRIAPASEGFLFLCEIARVSRALVSPDTSIIHAAALFRIPIVGLYRDPLLYREWAPYRAAHRALISTSGSVGGIDPDPAFSELRIALGED